MKALAAALLAGTVLLGATGCGATTPAPTPTATESFTQCATKAMAELKREHGVQYLIDQKDEAKAIVFGLCHRE